MTSATRALLALALVGTLAACDDGEANPTTTTSPVTTTSASDGSTTTSGGGEVTSTTLRGQVITDYQTAGRLSTANGEVLHLVVPVGGYTDVDLFNFLVDLKQAHPGLWGVEVFDDPRGPEVFAIPDGDRDEEQRTLLDRHHLVSLVEGDTIRYQGPFRSLGEAVIGS